MKANRRLGKGLDALLDLQPAGDDGSARVSEAVEGSSDRSVLSTSVPRAERTIQRRASHRPVAVVKTPSAAVRAPAVAAAPPTVAPPPAPAAPPPPPLQFQLFDPPLLPAPAVVPEPPASVAASPERSCEAPAPPPSADPAPSAAPPPVPSPADEGSAFLDDAVVGLAFPEVDLDS